MKFPCIATTTESTSAWLIEPSVKARHVIATSAFYKRLDSGTSQSRAEQSKHAAIIHRCPAHLKRIPVLKVYELTAPLTNPKQFAYHHRHHQMLNASLTLL